MRGGVRVFVVGVALSLSAPAQAQVLEIGGDGAVVRHAGPEVITPEGRQPLHRPAPEPRIDVGHEIESAAERTGVHPRLIEAVAWTESRHNLRAVSPKGARGVMQLMPETARDLGVDPNDPAQNILGGALYLRAQLQAFDGDVVKALAAYNAGPGAVRRHGGTPPYRETQDYVARVLARLAVTQP